MTATTGGGVGREAEPYALDEPDTSLGELTGRLTGEVGALVSDHIQLARAEIVADAKQAGRGVALLGAGAASGLIAALILSMALAWGLAEAVDPWLAFLIVGVAWTIAAGGMAMVGKRELVSVDPVPTETMDELERDKQWVREQTN